MPSAGTGLTWAMLYVPSGSRFFWAVASWRLFRAFSVILSSIPSGVFLSCENAKADAQWHLALAAKAISLKLQPLVPNATLCGLLTTAPPIFLYSIRQNPAPLAFFVHSF